MSDRRDDMLRVTIQPFVADSRATTTIEKLGQLSRRYRAYAPDHRPTSPPLC